MTNRVKTEREIAAMRESGRILASVLAELKVAVKPGVSTKELARVAAKKLKQLGGEPAFLGYQGFPDVLCVSLNNEVVHGIPRKDRLVRDGDIVSLDFGVRYQGMITDAAISVIAGEARDAVHRQLLAVTEEALHAGIKAVRGDGHTGDIGAAVQAVLDKHGYGIVRDLVGHGVGHQLHEDPNVPNYGYAGSGARLVPGMTIAIEPMATLGTYKVYVGEDDWTILTADGSWSAHFEHTVLVTRDGAEILTKAR